MLEDFYDSKESKLCLVGRAIKDEDALSIITDIAKFTSQNKVEKLSLNLNALKNPADFALLLPLEIKQLSLRANKISNICPYQLNTCLTKLDLGINQLRDNGAKIIAQNTTLTELDLSHNEVSYMGAVALSKNTTLRVLSLSHNDIGNQGAAAFSDTYLQKLDVSSADINDIGAIELAKSNLKTLYINNNKISLINVFKNGALTELEARRNIIEEISAIDLLSNTLLFNVDLDFNQKFNSSTYELLKEMKNNNKTLFTEKMRFMPIAMIVILMGAHGRRNKNEKTLTEVPKELFVEIFNYFAYGISQVQTKSMFDFAWKFARASNESEFHTGKSYEGKTFFRKMIEKPAYCNDANENNLEQEENRWRCGFM